MARISDASVTTHGVTSYVAAKTADQDHLGGGTIHQSAAAPLELGRGAAGLAGFSRSLTGEGLFQSLWWFRF